MSTFNVQIQHSESAQELFRGLGCGTAKDAIYPMISLRDKRFLSLQMSFFKLNTKNRSLTEVAVFSLIVDATHGDVPASSSTHAGVARPLSLQAFPGHP